MKIYCISGFGADHRAFERISLSSSHTLHHLPWLEPLAHESIRDYAERMAQGIDTSEAFILMGLSLGGIIALEIHQLYSAKAVILVSSVASPSQLPPYLKWAAKLQIYRLAGIQHLVKHPYVFRRILGRRKNSVSKYLRDRFLQLSDNYIRWSLRTLLTWGCEYDVPELTQIHGSRDRVFPHRFIKPHILIRGGSHFMIFSHARMVSTHIQSIADAASVSGGIYHS